MYPFAILMSLEELASGMDGIDTRVKDQRYDVMSIIIIEPKTAFLCTCMLCQFSISNSV